VPTEGQFSAAVDTLKAGIPQREVIELSGNNRESVRILARNNGIQPKWPR
jgi:hypothetical protein